MAGLKSAASQASRHLKILTLNVLASPVPHNRMEGERLDCLLKHIKDKNYDILAFQELVERHPLSLGHRARYTAFIAALREAGFIYSVAGPAAHIGVPLDGGTAIFSKHPIVSSNLHHWR